MKLKNKTKPNKPPLEAEKVPSRLRFTCEDGSIRLEAAAETEQGQVKLRRFSMTAYTGNAMVLAGCSSPGDVDGDLYRFETGDAVEIAAAADGGGITIEVAFDYLAAEMLPDTRPADIDCTLSDGLSVFSMERSEVDERKVGGEKVTPIMTIRARGESGVLECQHVLSGRESLRAVVLSASGD